MQNLLNEEEFIKSKPYNPWRWFFKFYSLMLVMLISFMFINRALANVYFDYIIYYIIFYILLAVRISLPFFMIFGKKENIMLPYKTIFLGVLGIYTVHFLYILIAAFCIMGLHPNFEILKTSLIMPFLHDSLTIRIPTIIIIFLIVMYKRKKALKRAI